MLLCLLSFLIISKLSKKISKTGNQSEYPSASEYFYQMNSAEINGVVYPKNQNIKTYLFVGLDKEGEAVSSNSFNNDCDADFLLLAVFDTENKTLKFLSVNRDTMTEVQMLSLTGQVYDRQEMQIALSYTYGDSLMSSLDNTTKAVSDLLYNCTIDGAMSFRLDGLGALMSVIGDVPVTFDADYTEFDKRYTAGNTVVMNEEMAMNFVRARTQLEDSTNLYRIERQKLFLDNLISFILKDEKSEDLLLKCFDAISPYSVSNISLSEISQLSGKTGEYEINPVISLDGTTRVGEFMEFYPDEKDLQKKVVSLFYTNE